jgi:hypothetical protein
MFTSGFTGLDETYLAVAHELGHGKFLLKHPFVKDYKLPRGKTDNLMDYAPGARHIAKWQWDLMHDPGVVARVFERDGDAMRIERISNGIWYDVRERGWSDYGFLSPAGAAVCIANVEKVLFNEDGAPVRFVANGIEYATVFRREIQEFLGYIDTVKYDELSRKYGGKRNSSEFENELRMHFYSGVSLAPAGKRMAAVARRIENGRHYECTITAIWENETKSVTYAGLSKPPLIPNRARKTFAGAECDDVSGLEEKMRDFYIRLAPYADDEDSLKMLCRYLDEKTNGRTFAFYADDEIALELSNTAGTIQSVVVDYFKRRGIYSPSAFSRVFKREGGARDCNVIFSTEDLWTFHSGYNANTVDYAERKRSGVNAPYVYSFADLRTRQKFVGKGDGVVAAGILRSEEEGAAQPLSQRDYAEQYEALFGTNSAIFSWLNYASTVAEDPVKAYAAYDLAINLSPVLLSSSAEATIAAFKRFLGKKATEDFVRGAIIEAYFYILVCFLCDGDQWADKLHLDDLLVDMTIAGIQNSLQLSKLDQALLACLKGIHVHEMRTVIDLIAETKMSQAWKEIQPVIFQCAASGFIEYILRNATLKEKVLNVLSANPARLPDFLEKIGVHVNKTSPKFWRKLWGLDDFLAKQGAKYNEYIDKLISSREGINLLTVIIGKREYGLPIITSVNLRKLNDMLPKFGNSPKFLSILKETSDLNTEIRRLAAKTDLENYNPIIFSEKLTVANMNKNGVRVTLREFMDSYYDDASNAYYKITENSAVFIHRKLDEIWEVTINFGMIADVTGRVIVEKITEYLKKTNNTQRESDEKE